jgi:hypothetical protein
MEITQEDGESNLSTATDDIMVPHMAGVNYVPNEAHCSVGTLVQNIDYQLTDHWQVLLHDGGFHLSTDETGDPEWIIQEIQTSQPTHTHTLATFTDSSNSSAWFLHFPLWMPFYRTSPIQLYTTAEVLTQTLDMQPTARFFHCYSPS